MSIKWDRSEVVNGQRVRTIFFQDHVNATPLRDYNNERMEITTWTGNGDEKLVLAEAKRVGRAEWTVSVFTETLPVSRKIVKRDRPIYRFGLSKEQAIEFMGQNS